jgi:putative flippase GtrA
MKHAIFRELLRFIGVGLLNSALDFAVFTLCVRGLELSLVAANFCAWGVAVSFSYFLNGRWTFSRSWPELLRLWPYVRFVVGNALSFVIATLALVVLARHMPVLPAKAVSLAIGFVVNFLVAKYLAFGMRAAG